MVISDQKVQALKRNTTKKGFNKNDLQLNRIYKPDCELIKQIILKGVVPDLIKHNKKWQKVEV